MTDKKDTALREVRTTPNVAHDRSKQIKQWIEQNMDMYRVEKMRGRFRATRARYVEMSKGGDGGKMNPTHVDSIRTLHHKDWPDSDFSQLVKDLDKAVEDFHREEGTAPEDGFAKDVDGCIKKCVEILSGYSHDDAVDILNSIAEQLQLFDPEDD